MSMIVQGLMKLRAPDRALGVLVQEISNIADLMNDGELLKTYGRMRRAMTLGNTQEAIGNAGTILDRLYTSSPARVDILLDKMITARTLSMKIKDSIRYLIQLGFLLYLAITTTQSYNRGER